MPEEKNTAKSIIKLKYSVIFVSAKLKNVDGRNIKKLRSIIRIRSKRKHRLFIEEAPVDIETI